MSAKNAKVSKNDADDACGTCCSGSECCCCQRCVSAFAKALRWLADTIEKCCSPASPAR